MARPIEFNPEMIPTKITTSIPYGAYKDCLTNGWGWKDVFMQGYRQRISNNDSAVRINQLQQQVESLKAALFRKEDKPIFRRG